jgi:multiple sugar transport system permease protein
MTTLVARELPYEGRDRERLRGFSKARKQWRRTVVGAGVNVPLWIAVAAIAVPYIYLVGAAFESESSLLSYPPQLFPSHPSTAEFSQLFHQTDFWQWFGNTAVIAVAVTILAGLLSSTAAYALAIYEFRGKRIALLLVVGILAIPQQVFLIPLYAEIIKFHLLNSDMGAIFPLCFSAFGIFLLRQYMLAVPREVIHAARVDGASEVRIYRSIVLPMVVPALGVFAMFTFNLVWNNFVWPLFVFSATNKFTLPVGLASLITPDKPEVGLALAGSFLGSLPTAAVFLWLQRYLKTTLA